MATEEEWAVLLPWVPVVALAEEVVLGPYDPIDRRDISGLDYSIGVSVLLEYFVRDDDENHLLKHWLPIVDEPDHLFQRRFFPVVFR